MGFAESTDFQRPPEGLLEAVETLEYLSNAGNKAAQQRLDELRYFCVQAWSPDVNSKEWKWLQRENLHTNPNATYSLPQNIEQGIPSQNLTDIPIQNPAVMSSMNPDHASLAWDFMLTNVFENDFTDEAEEIYTCFHDPNLPLTGVDELDWAEIGKVFQTREE